MDDSTDPEMQDFPTTHSYSPASCVSSPSPSLTLPQKGLREELSNPLQETLHVTPASEGSVTPPLEATGFDNGFRPHHDNAKPIESHPPQPPPHAETRKVSFVGINRHPSDGLDSLPMLDPRRRDSRPRRGSADVQPQPRLDRTNSSILSYKRQYDAHDSDEDNPNGAEFSSRQQMIALESMAPKMSSHIWVIQQGVEGKVEVFTPNTFKDVMALIHPYLKRDKFKDDPGAKARDRNRNEEQTHLPHIWVDFQGLTPEEVAELGEILVLHELTVEDMTTGECPEKLEVFDDLEYHYAMMHGHWPDYTSSSGWAEVSVSCILLYNFFITVHSGPFVGLDEMLRRVRKDFVMSESKRLLLEQNAFSVDPKAARLRKMKGLWLLYCLFDILVDALIPRVAHIWDHANQVDELILQLWGSKEPEMDDTTRIMARTRKHINDLRRSVTSKEWIIKENRLYNQPQYRDVLDHVQQMLHRLDSARDVVAQANSNYLAGVSVQAAIGANSTNDAMKRMSLFAFVFAPMTLVTSMFGMNVKVPFQDEKDTLPFWMILLFMFLPVAVGFAVYVWLGKRRRQRKQREKLMPVEDSLGR